MSNDYFFILGNHGALSLAEIVRVLDSLSLSHRITNYSKTVAIISTDSDLDISRICSRLGGTIKAGKLIGNSNYQDLESTLSNELIELASEQKLTFGISAYTLASNTSKNKGTSMGGKDIQRLGLSIKKELRSGGTPVRFVMPQQGNTLSSVTVSKNHLTKDQNREFVLLQQGGAIDIGVTQWVQPFEEYSKRDWDRPEKSMHVGMLPPKLAQMMINLSGVTLQPNTSLLDPFCGLGTVLQESWLMGVRNLYGSDLESRNVDSTEKNIIWIQGRHPDTTETDLHLYGSDVRKLDDHIDGSTIDLIVTEPYLGPIMNNRVPRERIALVQKELSELYIDAFNIFAKLLKPNGVVSMVWPCWRSGNAVVELPIVDQIKKLGFINETIPSSIRNLVQPSNRDSFIYARPDQTVMREVFVWRKK